MAGFASLFQSPPFNPNAGGFGSLYSQIDPNFQQRMKQQQLMGLAQGLLSASGPSPTPVGFGQVLGQGLQQSQQMGNDYQDKMLKEILLQGELAKAMKSDPIKVGAGETLYDPLTGKSVFESPMTKPVSVPAGGTLVDPKTGKPVFNAPPKPLPTTALKMQDEALESLGIANSLQADLGALGAQIDQGKLELGPIDNTINAARNWAGQSTEESRNYATFRSTLEKLRNDTLRLNKGVQTEGDAKRAWNEIMANLNDTKLVRERINEVIAINQRAADLKKLSVDQIRNTYNQGPFDFSKYDVKPAIGGTKQGDTSKSGPQIGVAEDGYVFLGGDPANPASWRKQ